MLSRKTHLGIASHMTIASATKPILTATRLTLNSSGQWDGGISEGGVGTPPNYWVAGYYKYWNIEILESRAVQSQD